MKILLAIDGSEAALEAVHHALRLVHSGLNATFVLANVQEPASLYEVVVAHDAKVLEDVSASAAAHSLEPAHVLLRTAGVHFEVDISHGNPGHLLVDAAERFGCGLIVMGERGVGTPFGSGLGSVAATVLRDAAVPVTLVKLAQE
jgi:nucleotide-binding universal stress UspA family protein